MTNKELQEFLKQFPDDADIWREDGGNHDPLIKGEIGFDYTTADPKRDCSGDGQYLTNVPYWVEENINVKKVKRIVL